jgi:hypothetical protein
LIDAIIDLNATSDEIFGLAGKGATDGFDGSDLIFGGSVLFP